MDHEKYNVKVETTFFCFCEAPIKIDLNSIRHASVDDLDKELEALHCTPPKDPKHKRTMLREHYKKVHGLKTKTNKKRKSKSCNFRKKKINQDQIEIKVEVKTEDQY